MPTAYSYLRFSRPEQLKGDSQRRQIELSRKWAERNDVPLDESLDLRDLGVSAFRGKNVRTGALGLFLKAIENGRVKAGDFLILENLDRLSRDDVFDNALPLVRQIIVAGVSIVTLSPERVYSRKSVREVGPLLEMLMALCLANDESRKKSERLSEAWQAKRRTAVKKKLTSIAPRWLTLAQDRTSFRPIPERVEVVKSIFRLAAEGAGATAITKRLNADAVPTFGSGKRAARFWQTSYVKKILANRAVLGEWQPYRMKDGKRVPVGEPVIDYYPAIVSPAQFYAAERSRKERKGVGGRNGDAVRNLFTGLLKDARDGSSLTIVNKGDGPSLVSSAARAGRRGSVYVSFPYVLFEQALLVWGYDLDLSDVLPKPATNLDAVIAEKTGRLSDVESRLAKLKERLRTSGDIDVLVDTVVALDRERKEMKAELDRLMALQATPESDAVGGLRSLIRALKRAEGETLCSLRLRLRQLLRRFVADIVVLTVLVNHERVAIVDVLLKNGGRRRVTISPPGRRVRLPEGLEKRDIRTWTKWPERLRTTRFDVTTEETREMIELDKRGTPRAEIATKMGVSVSHVSRTLLRCGRRKQTKKTADSERLMTWHPAGSGWVKRHRGKRYFVGMGTLVAAFPKLVKAKTAAGSWRAANAWWKLEVSGISRN
jgi:DNA invertase Pin-like site-specific DNA recombinase